MKSMHYYINLEKEINQSILEKFNQNNRLVDEMGAKPFKDIVIYATGSSSNAAQAASIFMQKLLNVPVYIKEPSIGVNYGQQWTEESLYIAISQGGHSYSTIELVKSLESKGMDVYIITSDLDSPIAKNGKKIIDMCMGVEEMPYVTAGYTATILILWLLTLNMSLNKGQINQNEKKAYTNKLKDTILLAEDIIKTTDEWYEIHKKEILNKKRFVFIGYGSCYGVVKEAETKFTEILHLASHGHELEEYMHGPYLGLQKDDALFLVDQDGILSSRMSLLRKFLNKHMTKTYLVTSKCAQQTSDLAYDLSLDEYFSPILLTIPFHLISYYISQEKGTDLTKSYYPDFDQITKSKI